MLAVSPSVPAALPDTGPEPSVAVLVEPSEPASASAVEFAVLRSSVVCQDPNLAESWVTVIDRDSCELHGLVTLQRADREDQKVLLAASDDELKWAALVLLD